MLDGTLKRTEKPCMRFKKQRGGVVSFSANCSCGIVRTRGHAGASTLGVTPRVGGEGVTQPWTIPPVLQDD
jgi:hypothetical protein